MKTRTHLRPTREDRAFVIDQISIFQGMGDEDKGLLTSMMEERILPKYQYVYKQGDSAEYIYLLAVGAVKIGTMHRDGREMIKRILHPQAVFGEVAIYAESSYHNFALTMNNEVKVYRIQAIKFRQLLRKSQTLNMNVLSMMGRRLANAERRLESLIFKDARARIVDFLKYNAETRGRQVGYETFFKHNLTQQDIANFTGTSRQTVTSVLNDLKKSNLIHFNRTGVLIRDMSKLR